MTDSGFGFRFDAGPWSWGRGWGRRHRGKRRRRVWFESGDMKYVILKLLQQRPMHGYEVMKELEEHTQGCYKPSPGTVYPTLQYLEDEGLVRVQETDGKKVYEITDAGEAFLAENETTVDDIFERVQETIDSLFADPVPDLTRLVGKLVPLAYRTSWHHRDDADTQKRVRGALERAVSELEAIGTSE